MWRRIRELGALLDEVADVNWRHPAWWGLTGGAALLEALARPAGAADPDADPYAQFLGANGGPRSDTFMARDRAEPPLDLAGRIARALLRARAGAAAIATLDGTLPGQPLACVMRWQRGWLRRGPAPSPPAAALVTPAGAFLAPLARSDAELGRALAAALAGRPHDLTPIDASARGPTPAAVAVAVEPEPLERARHLHRRAWTRGGGPWLGIGDAGPLELVTTCHLAVDGFGHGRVTSAVFAEVDRQAQRIPELAAVIRAALGGAAVATLPAPVIGDPMGFAGQVLRGRTLAFPAVAYGFGRALECCYSAGLAPAARRAARHSPSFQVPVAPGPLGDPERRGRRVLFAILALAMRDGEPEPFAEFRARLPALLERELAGRGVLTRILTATARAPLPAGMRRRLLGSSGRPHPLVPPIEILGGRGCLSSIRYPAGARPPAPLYAASSPALTASAKDPRGAVVLTVVHHDDAATVSVCGTGQASTHAGARAFLDLWLEELEPLEAKLRGA